MAVVVEILCDVCGQKAVRQRPPRRYIIATITKVIRERLAKRGWVNSDNHDTGHDICPDCWEGHDRSAHFRRQTAKRAKQRDEEQWREA